ncbi:MAG: leucine-rich repeat domain-containing protein, partial [Oscillospiraceae bacterium]|nr:leucine-rich repeat domain-containing protein [Oscillospiraceae bacterium]
MKKKRLYSMLCAWLFSTLAIGGNISALPLIPASVLTASATETTDQGLQYEITDGEIRITGHTDDLPAAVVIPDEIGGVPVTGIGDNAFSWCEKLTSVTLPDSLTRIGVGAFAGCTHLTDITIPKNVTSIASPALFSYCDALRSIAVDPDNTAYASADGVLFNKDLTQLLRYPIGNGGTQYSVPDSVTA